ncbi:MULTISPECIES: sugar ABC transporter substrate-binding protein [Burkholderia]|uniref:Sugar ABC transporter substrate-binding protein n=1 Tax=Burkholderia savannae TaxID=1637837 RepID=A0ABR5T857_9BURK|nr:MULTISPECIES: sugar ABC transporter substrate-binding protein [Burkholderia]AOJ71619.1 sugar ABC transporter substrate-binding protein [Burkholderia savannae]AOK50076.1 sugar ABC transporter substrate-binding protein [Burkholderia sp. MSMB617WGS]KGS05254.1 ABC sugar (Ribose) transporter, periplasmic substrate-binding subunit [Burkholderia sp. ABCPW 111]KVG47644.1 sugar ABC transporter substrate-binding protein [Burkholderia sp. MSMB0265]KVG80530.1 sugar ABC transporter substrate-binding pro
MSRPLPPLARLLSTLFAAALALGLAAASVRAAAPEQPDRAPPLAGKRIGITVAGTDHYWDLQAYQGAVDEVKRLGGTPIALDAGRNDSRQIAQIQTLIAQKPDAIIEQLGTASVLEPWLKKIRQAGIPLFTIDTASPSSLNVVTSDNFVIGSQLALKLVNDIRGEGNILVFNGFYGVPVCAIRYDQLKAVLKWYPKVKIIEPELRDVIPNTAQNAYAQISQLLQKYPKGSIAAIWAAWDIPQVGATQAVDAAGRGEIRTYAVDGSPEAVALVKNPKSSAAAVVAQQPALIGRTAVRNVARYLAGDRSLPAYTFVPSVLVTKDNAGGAPRTLGQASADAEVARR